MKVKNVVKVMNFHALVRVDNAKRQAARYMQMQEALMGMMAAIANNRNFRLDKSIFQPPADGKVLNIYIGSDFGFCGNYNYKINEQIRPDEKERAIVIGKKLHIREGVNVIAHIPRKEFSAHYEEIEGIIADAIESRQYAKILLTHIHYENTSTNYLEKLQIYPLQSFTDKSYTEDFEVEGKLDELYAHMLGTYVTSELCLALINSNAAENVLRQNATTESLKRIEEIEAEQIRVERKESQAKEFSKVVDNFSKRSLYEKGAHS